jgi:tetratricopeptide (TPR) repeat protein
MKIQVTLSFLIFLSCTPAATYSQENSAPRPLSRSELLALVAGDALPENIVGEIRRDGLAFNPDKDYESLLITAGATSTVSAALSSAKIVSGGATLTPCETGFLQHLSEAGKMIHSGKREDAERELAVPLSGDAEKAAAGYVMGLILIDLQQWDQVQQVYSEILEHDPDFPELHTRLSVAAFNLGDYNETLRQTKLALQRLPDNPSAHLNAGLAYQQLHHLDAAKSEMQLALRAKPDFPIAYSDLGGLLDEANDHMGAVAQYKKAIALNPNDADPHYSLGVSYYEHGDFIDAIQEYREAKRLDPSRLDVRQNLGASLMHTDPAAAITEFRELAALAPDAPICHQCLAVAYNSTGRPEDAEKEYAVAIKLDPANAELYYGLGIVKETEKKYDAALAEYHQAEQIDENYGAAHNGAGRVLIYTKHYADAIAELKRAEELNPADSGNYDLHGEALEASGNRDAAIPEYKQALSIAPKEIQARLDLAQALEKKGEWVAALDNYRQAALDEPPPKIGVPENRFEAKSKYEMAQQRFRQHLAALRASGKSAEATSLEAALRKSESNPSFDDAYHAAMQASAQAVMQKRFDSAETSAKKAIAIAERIQPPDARLPEAVAQLGNVYAWRLDYKDAEETFKHQLILSEKLYGPQSPELNRSLQNLAMNALAQKNFTASEAYFTRALDLNVKAFGENSSGTSENLRGLAHIYSMQKDFPKSELTLVRVVKIYETMYGPEDERMAIPLTSLCNVYDQWNKPEKSAPCHARLVALYEKHFGNESPYLVRDLNAEAQALRKLGKADDAAAVERRTETIQTAGQTNPN